MPKLKVKMFYGTSDAPMIVANACCDFVNGNPDVKVVEIVHANDNVFLYYRGDAKEDTTTPWKS